MAKSTLAIGARSGKKCPYPRGTSSGDVPLPPTMCPGNTTLKLFALSLILRGRGILEGVYNSVSQARVYARVRGGVEKGAPRRPYPFEGWLTFLSRLSLSRSGLEAYTEGGQENMRLRDRYEEKAEPDDHFTMTDCVRACQQMDDAVIAYRDALKARNGVEDIEQDDD